MRRHCYRYSPVGASSLGDLGKEPHSLKEINPEYSLERTDTEAEAPMLWPPDAKS